MNLVIGQNISLEALETIDITIGWRSLKQDLNLEVHAFALDKNKQLINKTPIDVNKILLPENMSRQYDDRCFNVELKNIVDQVDSIVFWALLPNKSAYSLTQADNFQVSVNNNSGKNIAKMQLMPFIDQDFSCRLFKLYRRNGQWKLSFKAELYKFKRLELLTSLGYPILKKEKQTKIPQKTTKLAPEPAQAAAPENKVADVVNKIPLSGINLNQGENFSLTEQFSHCKTLLFTLSSVPEIIDLELNIIALDSDDKISNIKDFLYRENRALRTGSVTLNSKNATIDLEMIPSDVNRLQLIATRPSQHKRINSADFIESKLSSPITEQPLANFTFETANKNYNAVILLDIYRHQNGWSVRAVGQGFADGLTKIGERYQFTPPRVRNTSSKNTTQARTSQITETSNIELQQAKKQQNKFYAMIAAGFMAILVGFSSPIFLFFGGISLITGVIFHFKNNKKLQHLNDEVRERTVLHIIRENNYYVSAFDVAANHSLTLEQATRILEDLCTRGLGKVTINKSSSTYYDFTGLKDSSEQKVSSW
jgi:stress response protein SCP2